MITTINTCNKYKLQQNRHTFTKYRKANWTQLTTDTDAAFSDIQPPPDIHTANTIFTNFIIHADKHNISKGKIHSTCKILPEHIKHKIKHRNNIRAQNASDPSISELNPEITSLIQTHKSDIWREHLDTHWDHKHNTHTLWNTRISQQNTNTTQQQHNHFQREDSHITHTYSKRIQQTIHQHSQTQNKHIHRKTLKLQTTNITLTTTSGT